MKWIRLPEWLRLGKGLLLLGGLLTASIGLANPDPPEARWLRAKKEALDLYRDLVTRKPETDYFAARSEGFEGSLDPSIAEEIRNLEGRNDWDVDLALEILRELADNRDSIPLAGGPHLATLSTLEEGRRICERKRDLFDAKRILKATGAGLVVGVCACGLANLLEMFEETLNPDACTWVPPGIPGLAGTLNREPGSGEGGAEPMRAMIRSVLLLVPPLGSGLGALMNRYSFARQEAALAEMLERGTWILERATGMTRLGTLIRLYAR